MYTRQIYLEKFWELSVDILCLVDLDNYFLDVSPAFEKILGYAKDEVVGKKYTDFLHPDDLIASQSEAKLYPAGHISYLFQNRYRCKDGLYKWLSWNSVPIPEEGLVYAIARDITERKQEQEALLRLKDELQRKVEERTKELTESEEKYRLLVENANEVILVVQDGRFPFFNSKVLELLGYTREEFMSLNDSQTIYPDDLEKVREFYRQRTRGNEVPTTYEIRVICKDGSMKWILANVVLISWQGKPAVLVLNTDITERKNLEQSLKNYAQRITQIQEEERKRIAYELHDDTAQYLSVLRLEIEALINSGKIQLPEVLEKLEFLREDAERAFNDVRRYSHELRPGVLEHLGLYAALEQIADDINKLNGTPVELHIEGAEPEISEDIKLAFFRIAQEAISNARKHANASRIILDLKRNHDNIEMVIKDNGIGFNPKEAYSKSAKKGNLGLMSMWERANLINADLKIESKPGKGAQVIIKVKI